MTRTWKFGQSAIAAIGRIKDRDGVDPLIRCLCDKEIIIRIGAAEVLGKLGDRRAIEPLKKLGHDPFSDVREAAAELIRRLSGKILIPCCLPFSILRLWSNKP